MVRELKRSIDAEIQMLGELDRLFIKLKNSNQREHGIVMGMMDFIRRRIKTINDSIPGLINKIPNVEGGNNQDVTSKKGYESEFSQQLEINENILRKLKKGETVNKEEKRVKAIGPNFYAKLSNKFFLKSSEKLINEGNFESLSLDLKKSNLNILTSTYVSMMFFSSLLAFFAGILLMIFFLFFSVGINLPFFSLYQGSYLERFAKVFWVSFAVPLIAGGFFYFYPGAEKRSLAGRINQELPFVVINMESISGSGIAPLKIFKIIEEGDEYKYVGKEIRKILNQTNLYGYDLTTALRNVARITPSSKFSELLTGISVTINSGGDIKRFFEKRAEGLLLNYRLEREKFTKTAETFMDIYISLVIATPMILLLLLVMIAVTGFNIGLGLDALTILIIASVAGINVLFMLFLHLKQPQY